MLAWHGFVKSEVDNNLYYLVVGGYVLILVLYVDNFFLTDSWGFIEDNKRDHATEFEMKDLGYSSQMKISSLVKGDTV